MTIRLSQVQGPSKFESRVYRGKHLVTQAIVFDMFRAAFRPCVRNVKLSRALPLRWSSSNALSAESPVTAFGPSPKVYYTENHEWLAVHNDKVAFLGVTKYAADALGDTTYVEVNEVPSDVEAGDAIGSVESVKSASDVYSPVAGKLVEANEELVEHPPLLNEDPMGAAWIAKIEISNVADLENLMQLEDYEASLTEDH